MRTSYPALGVYGRGHAGVCHYPGRIVYFCHLCLGHCADLDGLCGVADSGQQSFDANLDFVVEGRGSGTLLEAHGQMSTGLAGMRLEEAEGDLEEGLGEGLGGGLGGNPGAQNRHMLADSLWEVVLEEAGLED